MDTMSRKWIFSVAVIFSVIHGLRGAGEGELCLNVSIAVVDGDKDNMALEGPGKKNTEGSGMNQRQCKLANQHYDLKWETFTCLIAWELYNVTGDSSTCSAANTTDTPQCDVFDCRNGTESDPGSKLTTSATTTANVTTTTTISTVTEQDITTALDSLDLSTEYSSTSYSSPTPELKTTPSTSAASTTAPGVSEATNKEPSTGNEGEPQQTNNSSAFSTISFLMGIITAFIFVVIIIFVRKLSRNDHMGHTALSAHLNHTSSSRESIMLTELGVANGLPRESVTPMVIEVKYLPQIIVPDLPVYLKENRATGALKLQFHNLIPNNPSLAIIAASSDNVMKNRYKNIFPNDATRVILTSRVTTEDVGYINASYINGNDEEIAYIAAQGPLLSTLDDFWLMTWQEGVQKIVMLTHLTEGENRVKCEKYWPDEGLEICYGDIKVKCTSEMTFFSYILRTMNISCGDEEREIKQYHFIAWPDKKIPDDSSRLLRFIQEATPVDEPITRPVIVHCSAGIGRTGVYIAIDRQLRMIRTEETVNIFNCCQDMRSSRAWMVQTVEQYLFIYECVLEWTLCQDTLIPAVDFIKRANMADVEEERSKEFSALETVVPTTEELRQKHGKMDRNREKNRSEEILPQDGSRVILQRDDTDENYINASFVDGFVKPNEFISTQIPFQHTKQDFWEMVYEYDVTAIVLLDDGLISEDDIPFWPSREEDYVYGAISIHYETEEESSTYKKMTFSIHHEEDQDEIQCVYVYHITELPSLKGSIALLDPICDVIQALKTGKRDNPQGFTLVQCLDGVMTTGVFLACKMCVDQLELENGTDVYQAVKRVRKVQPKMVESESQYNLIFRVLERYIERQTDAEVEEATYANYRKGSATLSAEDAAYAVSMMASIPTTVLETAVVHEVADTELTTLV